jgi:hypothetical protein
VNVVWRRDRNGVAHVCRGRWVTALCGAQTIAEVAVGSPCPRCLQLATDRVLADEAE